MKKYRFIIYLLIFFVFIWIFISILKNFRQNQKPIPIPDVYSNIHNDDFGQLYYEDLNGEKFYLQKSNSAYPYENFRICPKGSETGLDFDFKIPDFQGKLYYGFILMEKGKSSQNTFFKKYSEIENGKASIDIKNNMSANMI